MASLFGVYVKFSEIILTHKTNKQKKYVKGSIDFISPERFLQVLAKMLITDRDFLNAFKTFIYVNVLAGHCGMFIENVEKMMVHSDAP